MDRFHVRIISMTGRPFLVAEWRDPASGKLKRKSTGHKVRREAERYAAKLEKQLNDGEYLAAATKWEDFRNRYEEAHKDRWAAGTAQRVAGVLAVVERILAPRYVRAVDSAAVLKLSATLAAEDKSPAGIASVLRHVKAALRWAARKGMIHRVPDIEMPEGASQCGGRAISGEEFERLLAAVPKALQRKKYSAVSPDDVASWCHFLRLLWTTGLRIGEAVKLHWTDDRDIMPDLRGKYPMFRIKSKASKNRKDQRFPMSPEAYAMLCETPEGERVGLVSSPTIRGRELNYHTVSETIGAIGRKAGVVVGRDKAGEPIFCTAHDLRRSAATRWAAKVTPGVLQAMMRHASPTTTAKYYTDQGGEPIAAAIWEAMSSPAAGITIETTISEPGPAAVVSG